MRCQHKELRNRLHSGMESDFDEATRHEWEIKDGVIQEREVGVKRVASPEDIVYKKCDICTDFNQNKPYCEACAESDDKIYWENAVGPLCNYTKCVAGMGLAGRGICFLEGSAWDKDCEQFKTVEDLRKESESGEDNG